MTVTTARKFCRGDRVTVGRHAGAEVWTVAGDDTGRTPVHDPEPAYKLLGSARADGYQPTRFAYESDLVRVDR